MFLYDLLDCNREKLTITFYFNGDTSLQHTVDVTEFDEYVLLRNHNYYIDMESGVLKLIDRQECLYSLREPTRGFINIDDKYYRPAHLSEIDYDQRNFDTDSHNYKMYLYLLDYFQRFLLARVASDPYDMLPDS